LEVSNISFKTALITAVHSSPLWSYTSFNWPFKWITFPLEREACFMMKKLLNFRMTWSICWWKFASPQYVVNISCRYNTETCQKQFYCYFIQAVVMWFIDANWRPKQSSESKFAFIQL